MTQTGHRIGPQPPKKHFQHQHDKQPNPSNFPYILSIKFDPYRALGTYLIRPQETSHSSRRYLGPWARMGRSSPPVPQALIVFFMVAFSVYLQKWDPKNHVINGVKFWGP